MSSKLKEIGVTVTASFTIGCLLTRLFLTKRKGAKGKVCESKEIRCEHSSHSSAHPYKLDPVLPLLDVYLPRCLSDMVQSFATDMYDVESGTRYSSVWSSDRWDGGRYCNEVERSGTTRQWRWEDPSGDSQKKEYVNSSRACIIDRIWYIGMNPSASRTFTREITTTATTQTSPTSWTTTTKTMTVPIRPNELVHIHGYKWTIDQPRMIMM